MHIHPPTHSPDAPDAGWPETDLTCLTDLDLAAAACRIAITDPAEDVERRLRLFALAEIAQEVNRRRGVPTGPTLPMSARGCHGDYVAYQLRAGRTQWRVRRLRRVGLTAQSPSPNREKRKYTMSTTTLTITTTRRSPLARELRKAGTSRREIAEFIDQLRGPNWLYALDACLVFAEHPVAARAIAAHAINAVAGELHRVGDQVTAHDLMGGVAHFRWIDRDNANHLRTACQLFDQARLDACGRTEPDRFAELVNRDPRTAARALTGAVILLTHRFPDKEFRS